MSGEKLASGSRIVTDESNTSDEDLSDTESDESSGSDSDTLREQEASREKWTQWTKDRKRDSKREIDISGSDDRDLKKLKKEMEENQDDKEYARDIADGHIVGSDYSDTSDYEPSQEEDTATPETTPESSSSDTPVPSEDSSADESSDDDEDE